MSGTDLDRFIRTRPRLLAIAHRIVGNVHESEAEARGWACPTMCTTIPQCATPDVPGRGAAATVDAEDQTVVDAPTRHAGSTVAHRPPSGGRR